MSEHLEFNAPTQPACAVRHPIYCRWDGMGAQTALCKKLLPQTKEESDAAEIVLAAELARLSLDEHEKILFDLHGITDVIGEDPDTIETALYELQNELDAIKSKAAYDLAYQMNKDYVTSPAFRLIFLRAVRYDVRQAAEVMVCFFENKRKLFGDGDILVRKIRQSDLTEEERELLYKGIFQYMPKRDVSNRPVMAMMGDMLKVGSTCVRQLVRPFIYLRSVVLDDPEVQKNGVVWVMYSNEHSSSHVAFVQNLFRNSCSTVPLHAVGAHFCGTDPRLRGSVAGYQLHSPYRLRFRIRAHIGTHQETNFELQTFGIRTEDSPLQPDGTWSTSWHQEWLEKLRVQEEAETAYEALRAAPRHITDAGPETASEHREECSRHEEKFGPAKSPIRQEPPSKEAAPEKSVSPMVPQRFDILLGKTKRSLDHTGNRRLAHMCEMHHNEYTAANRAKKTEIADRLVSSVHECGGRFLKWDDESGWFVVENVEARNKVAHTFRHLRAKLQKKEKESTTSGDTNDGEVTASTKAVSVGGSSGSVPKRTSPAAELESYEPASPESSSGKKARQREEPWQGVAMFQRLAETA